MKKLQMMFVAMAAMMAGVSGAGAVGRCDSTAETLRLGMAGYTFKAERDIDPMRETCYGNPLYAICEGGVAVVTGVGV